MLTDLFIFFSYYLDNTNLTSHWEAPEGSYGGSIGGGGKEEEEEEEEEENTFGLAGMVANAGDLEMVEINLDSSSHSKQRNSSGSSSSSVGNRRKLMRRAQTSVAGSTTPLSEGTQKSKRRKKGRQVQHAPTLTPSHQSRLSDVDIYATDQGKEETLNSLPDPAGRKSMFSKLSGLSSSLFKRNSSKSSKNSSKNPSNVGADHFKDNAAQQYNNPLMAARTAAAATTTTTTIHESRQGRRKRAISKTKRHSQQETHSN